jgi:hypothetical protein
VTSTATSGCQLARAVSGMSPVRQSPEADKWSRKLGLPFHEAIIACNGRDVALIVSDLVTTIIVAGSGSGAVSAPRAGLGRCVIWSRVGV